MIKFEDADFLSAKGKSIILAQWRTFLKYKMQEKHFTKRLYEHLILHCGYIAHYNIHGFYAEYFKTGPDIRRFFSWLFSENNRTMKEYDDLLQEMKKVYLEYEESIFSDTREYIKDRLDILEACIGRAKKDEEFGLELVAKLGL